MLPHAWQINAWFRWKQRWKMTLVIPVKWSCRLLYQSIINHSSVWVTPILAVVKVALCYQTSCFSAMLLMKPSDQGFQFHKYSFEKCKARHMGMGPLALDEFKSHRCHGRTVKRRILLYLPCFLYFSPRYALCPFPRGKALGWIVI